MVLGSVVPASGAEAAVAAGTGEPEGPVTRVTTAEQDAAREELVALGVRRGGRPIRRELWQRALRRRRRKHHYWANRIGVTR